ncbi:MAG: transposase [Opitutus sp.]|nr:transposase [Opitutus sp.]
MQSAIAQHGAPEFIRSDNGPEFIAKELQRWLAEQNIKTISITPASPWENGFVESFHSRFRDECLNREQLWTLTEPRVVIEDFRLDYNAERPHSSLGYLSPQRFGTEKSLPIPSSGPDRQAGPSLRLGLPTTTAVITSNNAADQHSTWPSFRDPLSFIPLPPSGSLPLWLYRLHFFPSILIPASRWC